MSESQSCWMLRAALAVLLALVGTGCFLQTGGIELRDDLPPVTSNVTPTVTCPGDPVNVTWNGGPVGACEDVGRNASWGSGCEPVFLRTAVSVSSVPDLFAAAPVAATETRGSRTVSPTEDTAFTIGFTRAAGDLTYSDVTRVNVLVDEGVQPAAFPRVCFGGAGRWSVLEASVGPGSPPARLRILEVCNPNGFDVDIEIVPAGTPFSLAPGACTGELRPTRSVALRGLDPVAAATLLGGENCRATATSPPIPGNNLPMQVRLGCEPL